MFFADPGHQQKDHGDHRPGKQIQHAHRFELDEMIQGEKEKNAHGGDEQGVTEFIYAFWRVWWLLAQCFLICFWRHGGRLPGCLIIAQCGGR